MINQYSIENFKIHKKSELIHFDGLTIFSGTNNSGKTSMIQSIRLLSLQNVTPFALNTLPLEQIDDLGGLKDTLNKSVGRDAVINYSFVISNNEGEECFVSLDFGTNIMLENIAMPISKEEAVLKTFTLRFLYQEEAVEFRFQLQDEKITQFVSYAMFQKNDEGYLKLEEVPVFRFLPVSLLESIKEDGVKNELREWLRELNKLDTNKIRYLGPYRMIPQRAKHTGSDWLEIDGSNCAEILNAQGEYFIYDSKTKLIDAFHYWTEKIMESEFDAKYEQETYKLVTNEDGVELEVHQLGFGNVQILPIILHVLLAKPGDLVVIENPEVHLHPKWKAKLVELLYDAVKYGVKILIETQSVEMITRIRLMVKQNPELEKMTKLYFFEKNGFESDIKYIEIDKTGSLSVWPKDFLDEVMMEDNAKLI